MPNPSPRSHLYRLAVVLGIFFVGFAVIRSWATPSSWNYEVWYRGDTVTDVQRLPLIYGGNESCETCHKKDNKKLMKFKHKGLSCESCHGALADHARAGKKVAAAKVDKSNWQCLNCHSEQINRPENFPQFSKTGEIGKLVRKHKELDDQTLCLKCHDAHDPTP